MTVVPPPATLGILGGGPTARYLQYAARTLGYHATVLDPTLPAAELLTSASTCDVVTVVDQLPLDAMRTVAANTTMLPSPGVVELCLDRVAVKRWLQDLDVAVGPYAVVESDADVESAAATKFPSILKLRSHGRGRAGQVRVANDEQLPAAWETLARQPCILEQRLMLGRELSIVVSRARNGDVATYPVAQQQYVHGRLEMSYAPATLPGSGQSDGAELASYIATELAIVGVLTVHMFVVGRDVYVHELVPRPGPLGLYTLNGTRTDQYEQQLRAVCGLALGDTAMTVPGIAIVNLMRDMRTDGTSPQWDRVLNESSAHLHLYDDSDDAAIIGHLAACSGTAAGSTSVVRRLRKQLTTS